MKSTLIILAVVLLALSQTNCGSKNTQSALNANSANASSSGEVVVDASAQSEAQKLLEQGNELARQDQDKEAAEVYQKAINLYPDFAEAHLKLAMSYDVLEQKKEAEEEYKKAAEAYQKFVRVNSKDARAYFNMGLAYNRVGKPDEAVKAFRQAVKLDEENSDYQYELGLAYSRAAQYQESVNALQKATEIDPDNYRAQDALEKAKIDLQRWQSMVKQQEAIAKRQTGKKNENTNANANLNSNVAATPTPEIH
ncbi:MAG: protein O-mannosyl-transferase [Acidobacteriota bacterium]|jgi:tetratricopeptide (TPR) repeat protein|nr:protein O-mannosyl-transferase [Acidobacteriota bacterium]